MRKHTRPRKWTLLWIFLLAVRMQKKGGWQGQHQWKVRQVGSSGAHLLADLAQCQLRGRGGWLHSHLKCLPGWLHLLSMSIHHHHFPNSRHIQILLRLQSFVVINFFHSCPLFCTIMVCLFILGGLESCQPVYVIMVWNCVFLWLV